VKATLVAVALLLGAGFAAAAHLTLGFRAFTAEDARRLRVSETAVALSPLEILDAQGARRTLWNTDPTARAWLVTFIYTRCPSACLAAGTEMQQLQAAARASGSGVRFLSLSFDRANDTREELARYAARFRADPSLWLVGAPASDAALARLLTEAGVVVIGDGMGGYAHNAAIHVVTREGRLAGIFDLESHREALAFAERVAP
jgi:protein SCO1/2